jgi:hypothetical protein
MKPDFNEINDLRPLTVELGDVVLRMGRLARRCANAKMNNRKPRRYDYMGKTVHQKRTDSDTTAEISKYVHASANLECACIFAVKAGLNWPVDVQRLELSKLRICNLFKVMMILAGQMLAFTVNGTAHRRGVRALRRSMSMNPSKCERSSARPIRLRVSARCI